MDSTQTSPYGYCQCGCGEKTKLAAMTDSSRGIIKGKPSRYMAPYPLRIPHCHIQQPVSGSTL
jgi:hypothetical protein